jgi:hypothetical protein
MDLDSPALWSLALGFLSPPVISIIQQTRWSERTQSLVAFGFYLVTAAVTVWLSGDLNGGDYVRTALLIFIAGSTSYKAFWKPTGISPAIEAVTPPPPPAGRRAAG